jgi:hypothetical protein
MFPSSSGLRSGLCREVNYPQYSALRGIKKAPVVWITTGASIKDRLIDLLELDPFG